MGPMASRSTLVLTALENGCLNMCVGHEAVISGQQSRGCAHLSGIHCGNSCPNGDSLEPSDQPSPGDAGVKRKHCCHLGISTSYSGTL